MRYSDSSSQKNVETVEKILHLYINFIIRKSKFWFSMVYGGFWNRKWARVGTENGFKKKPMLRPQFIHKKGHCGHGPKIFKITPPPPPSSNTNKETHTPTNSAKNIHTYTDTQAVHTPINTHIDDHSPIPPVSEWLTITFTHIHRDS